MCGGALYWLQFTLTRMQSHAHPRQRFSVVRKCFEENPFAIFSRRSGLQKEFQLIEQIGWREKGLEIHHRRWASKWIKVKKGNKFDRQKGWRWKTIYGKFHNNSLNGKFSKLFPIGSALKYARLRLIES